MARAPHPAHTQPASHQLARTYPPTHSLPSARAQLLRRPRDGWQPPATAWNTPELQAEKQLLRAPRDGWQPPATAWIKADDEQRARLRRYLPLAANPTTPPFSLPAEPRHGYIEVGVAVVSMYA